MLSIAAQYQIAAESYGNRFRYIVITDNSDNRQPGFVDDVEFGTVVLKTNSYDSAERTTNFWDARMNVHLVDTDAPAFATYRAKEAIVSELASNDLGLPSESSLAKDFSDLSALDRMELRSQAAVQRIDLR